MWRWEFDVMETILQKFPRRTVSWTHIFCVPKEKCSLGFLVTFAWDSYSNYRVPHIAAASMVMDDVGTLFKTSLKWFGHIVRGWYVIPTILLQEGLMTNPYRSKCTLGKLIGHWSLKTWVLRALKKSPFLWLLFCKFDTSKVRRTFSHAPMFRSHCFNCW